MSSWYPIRAKRSAFESRSDPLISRVLLLLCAAGAVWAQDPFEIHVWISGCRRAWSGASEPV